MPWLVFRESDDKYLGGRRRVVWTRRIESATRFKSRLDAEATIMRLKIAEKMFCLEVSYKEILGRDPLPTRAPVSLAEKQYRAEVAQRRREENARAESRKRIEQERQEMQDVPYRTMATRLLFGDDMPPGIENPYFLGMTCTDQRRTRRAEMLAKIDDLAAKLKSGEAQPPRYVNGDIALPLPRRNQQDPLRLLTMEARSSNFMSRVDHKPFKVY